MENNLREFLAELESLLKFHPDEYLSISRERLEKMKAVIRIQDEALSECFNAIVAVKKAMAERMGEK